MLIAYETGDKMKENRLGENIEINQYNLAGAAFWEKDMEPDSIWNLVSSKLGI